MSKLSAELKYLEHQFRYFQDPFVTIITMTAAIIVYWVELTSFTFSIDEELFAYIPLWETWVTQGRWSMALFSLAFPQHAATPFIAPLLFCLGLAATALIFSGCFARTRDEALAFSVLFVSCPVWPHVAQFNQLSGGYGIGLVFAATSVALMQRCTPFTALMAGLAASIAIAFHQSIAAIMACGMVLNLCLQTVAPSTKSRTFISGWAAKVTWTFVAILISVTVYLTVARLVLDTTQLKLNYVDSFLKIEELVSPSTWAVAALRIWERISLLFGGTDPLFLGWGGAVLVLSWLGLATALWRYGFSLISSPIVSSIKLVFLIGAIAAACASIVGSAGTSPVRSIGALALLYALSGAATMNWGLSTKLPQYLLLMYSLLVNAWISSSLFNADAIARQRDELVANEIVARINQVRSTTTSNPLLKFTMVGMLEHETKGTALKIEVFGSSFFEHGGGNIWRVQRYLQLMGVRDLYPVSIDTLRDKLADVDRMPAWPAPGSVAMVDQVLVLKFGELTSGQKAQLSR
jgi:hypothetical protein